jgi:hypothetical protein
VEKMIIIDPPRFCIHLAACKKFTVDDISFDFTSQKPGTDGIHLQGGCSEGRITNIKGNTYDDMVALNADDWDIFEITKGPITDIQIDGLWSTNCFRAVRFLTTGTPIKRVSISNVFGSYFCNTIAFTHWRLPVKEGTTSFIEDISINNIFTAKVTDPELIDKLFHDHERKSPQYAIIGCEGGLALDNITISNVFHREWLPNASPTIYIQRGAKIGTMHLRGIHQVNMTDVPLTFFLHEGSIVRLFVDGVVIREKNNKEKAPVSGAGTILKQYGEFVLESEQELIDQAEKVNRDIHANPLKENPIL